MPDHASLPAPAPLSSYVDIKSLVTTLVGRDQRVLELGCGDGDLGSTLTAHGCRVTGIEPDAAAARVAAERMERVVVDDLRAGIPDAAKDGPYDVVVLTGVLLDLNDANQLLADIHSVLAPHGQVVVGLPGARDRVEAARAELVMRDHVLGLQAEATSAQQRARQLERRIKGLTKRLERRNEEIALLKEHVTRLEAGFIRRVARRLLR